MTVSTGAALIESDTATVTVISDTVAISDGSFDAGTKTALNPTDETAFADVVLTVIMAVAPDAGGAFHLYRRDLNIDSTNDAPVPDSSNKNTYVGSFPLDLITTVQYVPLKGIPITTDQEFYIENDSGQATTTSTTTVKITPRAYNVK